MKRWKVLAQTMKSSGTDICTRLCPRFEKRGQICSPVVCPFPNTCLRFRPQARLRVSGGHFFAFYPDWPELSWVGGNFPNTGKTVTMTHLDHFFSPDWPQLLPRKCWDWLCINFLCMTLYDLLLISNNMLLRWNNPINEYNICICNLK